MMESYRNPVIDEHSPTPRMFPITEVYDDSNTVHWALELLDRDVPHRESLISKYGFQMSSGFFGCIIPMLANAYERRPIFSSLHRTIIGTVAGLAIGHYANSVRDEQLRKRDALMRDYVARHPERFYQPPKRKLADVFERWHPAR